jgi:flagellar biosynthetic protein FlhB
VPRSRDLNAAAVVLAGGLGLLALGSLIGGRLLTLMHDGLMLANLEGFDDARMLMRFGHAAMQAALAIAPLIGLVMAAAVLAPLAIGGWTFSAEALAPKFERLNPLEGLRRIWSVRGLIELGKALARVLLVALIAAVVMRLQFHSYSALGTESVRAAIAHSLNLGGAALIALGGALAVIALIDVPLQLWQFHQSMRMTRQEIREENKESEGSPEIKARVRRAQQALARKRMMQEVPKADVVVTNPTHFAVALRYDDKVMAAPIVIAKGRDLIAARIREIAGAHKIPIVEAPPLARALHAHCELGDPIPARLYAAVAKVLTYVYQLRTVRRHGGPEPTLPVVEVPEE